MNDLGNIGLMSRSNANLAIGHEGEDDDHEYKPQVIHVDDAEGDGEDVFILEQPNGDFIISIDGKPVVPSEDPEADPRHFANLADRLSDAELSEIAEDLLAGIDDDLQSSIEVNENAAKAIKSLALKVVPPTTSGTSEGAPVEGMSNFQHPAIQEQAIAFQATAMGELCSVDGPLKIRDDATKGSAQRDEMSKNFEKDCNHYLTVEAPEFVPGLDSMLLCLGVVGESYRKVYFSPIKNRPVSDTVNTEDLIVNESATDLSDAIRITHRTYLRPTVVKRLMLSGVYRDIDLGDATQSTLDAVTTEKRSQEGVKRASFRPQDIERETYECYCELDIPGFEHKYKGKKSGLAVPYRVTIDVSSRNILAIVRNYRDNDDEFPVAMETFVKYTFIPGLGFHGIGLFHMLGNLNSALTAIWRESIDAGMFANFPGFLLSDVGGRQVTTNFRIPPGGAALVKTGGLPITQAAMPLPYKEPGPAMMGMAKELADTAMRVGGAAQVTAGEGKLEAPVGTMLAVIEQKTKVLNSVHKRLHASLGKELSLILDCFRDHPESFIRMKNVSGEQWDEASLIKMLNDTNLVPRSDPNTASQSARLAKIMVLKQLQAANPKLYNDEAVDSTALRAIGFNNPEQFFVPKEARGQPSPEEMADQAEIKIKKQDADSRSMLAQAKVQEMQTPDKEETPDNTVKIAEINAGLEKAKITAQTQNEKNIVNLQLAQMKIESEGKLTQAEHEHDNMHLELQARKEENNDHRDHSLEVERIKNANEQAQIQTALEVAKMIDETDHKNKDREIEAARLMQKHQNESENRDSAEKLAKTEKKDE